MNIRTAKEILVSRWLDGQISSKDFQDEINYHMQMLKQKTFNLNS